VYELEGAGKETVLHSFTGGVDGGQPYGGVIGDSAGNLYGTTYSGGPPNKGVVYKLDPAGHESVLHAFTGRSDGQNPYAGVIRDSAGNLYGTTCGGGGEGCPGCGTVYRVDAAGNETVLHSFVGPGINPYAGVIRYSAGHLYGTTFYEGMTGGTCRPYGCGVVYELDAAGREVALHTFSVAPDGANAYAGVVRDSAGNLYGTASSGGMIGLGIVYKLDAAGHETVLYNFPGGSDGAHPVTGVIRDSAGNLYGTTGVGGTHGYGVGNGTVYMLDGTGTEKFLYSFGGDGYPSAVIRDSAGELFGTLAAGGLENCGYSGCVYKLNEAGEGKVLYSFTGGADGVSPYAGVIRDPAGNLFGTTHYGGIFNFVCSGGTCGVVYRLDTNGQETVLYSFTGGADGALPAAAVIRDANGNLYGTTVFGGTQNDNCAYGCGVVFKLDTAGRETVLHSFKGGADGAGPEAGVIRDSAGNLYGTTSAGGIKNGSCPGGCGVVFKVDAAGHEKVLYSFTGGADGAYPSGVVWIHKGNLYGTTLVGGTLGNCYDGPSTCCGVVFKVDTAGNETVLYSFTGGVDGGNPWAGVLLDSAGNLYGTASGGGAANMGVVFEIPGAATPAEFQQ
jgi:uncharacterized repeat protein (TIGR03803 family)